MASFTSYADVLERDLERRGELDDVAKVYLDKLRLEGELSPQEIASLYPEINLLRVEIREFMRISIMADRETDLGKKMLIKEKTAFAMNKTIREIRDCASAAAKIDSLNATTAGIQYAKAVLDVAVDLVDIMFYRILNKQQIECFATELRKSVQIIDDGPRVKTDRRQISNYMDQISTGQVPVTAQ